VKKKVIFLILIKQHKESGMTALITGASSGLGWEFAKLFACDGHDLVLVARRIDRLNELKTELEKIYNIKVTVFSQDLTLSDAAESVFSFIERNKITVDFLVNNAGFGDFGFFAECDIAKQQNMIMLNTMTLTKLTRLFVPGMKERKNGRILNVGSIASFMPGPKMSVYYATKAYVRSFSEALSVELKKSGVSVTVLCPGPVKSEFWDKSEADSSSIYKHMFFSTPEKVALCGYKKMKKGRLFAIPGKMTNIIIFLAKIVPRSWTRNIVYMVQK